MRVTYKPTGINNFHSCPPINLIVTGKTYDGGALIAISEGQKRRIEKHFCGISDCQCPAGAVEEYVQGIYSVKAQYIGSK